MYQIYFGEDVLYDPRGANDTDNLNIWDAKLELAVSSAGTLTFSLDSKHPLYDKLTRMKGIVTVLEDEEPIFKGRIVKDTVGFYKTKDVEVEGQLACLNDSIVKPYAFPEDFLNNTDYQAAASGGNVIAFWLGWLLDQHNSQVGDEQKIYLGNVTMTDPNNYITRSNEDYSTTWETITEKFSGSSLGGYLLTRYADGKTYLDYLADLTETNAQAVSFAENLLDMDTEVDGSNYYTAILPVGAEGLTIADLADGSLGNGLVKSGSIIYDSNEEAGFGGRITTVQTWDDVTINTNLQTKAAEVLASSGVKMPETITCKACDLHGLDGTASFRVGQWVQVISQPHDLADLYRLTELSIDLLDPSNTQITLGETKSLSSSLNRSAAKAATEAATEVKAAVMQSQQTLNSELNQVAARVTKLEGTMSGSVTPKWTNVSGKPFETLGAGLTVRTDGTDSTDKVLSVNRSWVVTVIDDEYGDALTAMKVWVLSQIDTAIKEALTVDSEEEAT